MLSELTPYQFCELRAAIDVVGLDDGWQQAGTVAATVNNKIEQFAAGMAGENKVAKDRLAKAEDYIPLLRLDKKQKRTCGMMTPGRLLKSLNVMMRR